MIFNEIKLLKRIIFLVVIVQLVELSLGIDQEGSGGFVNGNIISKLESDSTNIDCPCRRLRLLCQIGFACKEYRQKCKCTKLTTLTTSSSSIVTPDNYCPDCKQFCEGRNLNCMKKWDDYCTECSETCNKQGWEIFLFPIFVLKARISKEELCYKCRTGCDNYDPEEDENCSRYYCNECEMSCRTINTSDPEIARCAACQEKCNNKNLGCSDNLLEHCSQCRTTCGKLCDSESNCIYLGVYFYNQRPWLPEWTKAELCEYCATKCIGWYPGMDDLECELTRCNLCDEKLQRECKPTVTTPRTLPTLDPASPYCVECREMCDGVDLGCSPNRLKYCKKCKFDCWGMFFDFVSIPTWIEWTKEQLCKFCTTECIGWDPYVDDLDCSHRRCIQCTENVLGECEALSSGQISDQVTEN